MKNRDVVQPIIFEISENDRYSYQMRKKYKINNQKRDITQPAKKLIVWKKIRLSGQKMI